MDGYERVLPPADLEGEVEVTDRDREPVAKIPNPGILGMAKRVGAGPPCRRDDGAIFRSN